MPATDTLTALLGTRLPLVSAPMAGVSGGALVTAFTQAGGLGLLGVGYQSVEWIRSELSRLPAGVPFGAGFITWRLAEQPELLANVLDLRPRAVMLSFGDIDAWVPAIHAAGARVLAQVQTVAQARRARDAGADVIVAQGGEAGGHGGRRGSLALVPAVVDAVPEVPVLAAGGVADGRGLVAAMALGASGALLGTALYASQESLAHPHAKQRALSASGDDTVQSSVFDQARGLSWPSEWRLRALQNDFTRQWAQNQEGLALDLPNQQMRYRNAVALGDTEVAAVIVGEAVGMVRAIEPVADIVQRLVQEARHVLGQLDSGWPGIHSFTPGRGVNPAWFPDPVGAVSPRASDLPPVRPLGQPG